MDSEEVESGVLWAARLGELCGGAGTGPAPSWAFLDAWLELTGGTAGCLRTVGLDGTRQHLCRGLMRDGCAGEEPASTSGLTVVPGASAEDPPRLDISVADPVRGSVVLSTEGTAAARADAVRALFPLLERALLQLAATNGSETDDAAGEAWLRSTVPMLLLRPDLNILASNPACVEQLGLNPERPLPDWLRCRVEAGKPDPAAGDERTWVRDEAGVVHCVSVLCLGVAASGARWLVTVTHGGPDLAERVRRAGTSFGLTPGETEILELLAEGLSNRKMASARGVKEATIKFHVGQLMRKCDAASRTELIAQLFTLHLVDPSGVIPSDAIRIRTGYVWQDEEGFVRVVQDDGVVLDVPDIEQFTAAVKSFHRGEPLFVYSDATGIRSSSPAAQKAASQKLDFMGALAIRGGAAVSRAMVNLFLKIFPQPHPTRLFRADADALAWLRRLRDEA